MYFVNYPFNYLPTTAPAATLVQLQPGEVGWLSCADPTQVEFGPVGIDKIIVDGNPAWFMTLTSIPYSIQNQPAQGSIVYTINNSSIKTGPYMPTGQTGQDYRDQDNWATGSLWPDIVSAQDELEYRFSRKLLVQLGLIYNNGWIPDWNNKTQVKWFLVRKYGVIQPYSTTEYDYGAPTYFINNDAAAKALLYMGALAENLF